MRPAAVPCFSPGSEASPHEFVGAVRLAAGAVRPRRSGVRQLALPPADPQRRPGALDRYARHQGVLQPRNGRVHVSRVSCDERRLRRGLRGARSRSCPWPRSRTSSPGRGGRSSAGAMPSTAKRRSTRRVSGRPTARCARVLPRARVAGDGDPDFIQFSAARKWLTDFRGPRGVWAAIGAAATTVGRFARPVDRRRGVNVRCDRSGSGRNRDLG